MEKNDIVECLDIAIENTIECLNNEISVYGEHGSRELIRDSYKQELAKLRRCKEKYAKLPEREGE